MFAAMLEVNPIPAQFDVRLRTIRVVREYGMFDRREAPQYFEDAARHEQRS